MSNDSSTGGPLLPLNTYPAPLEGQALNRFLQTWVAGLTGLDGTLVRPRWQAEPPSFPVDGTAWAAIGVTRRPSDTFPHVRHDPTGEGFDVLYRHERLAMLCSFYDLGTNGQADYYCALLRDGGAIAQNREILILNQFELVNFDEPIAVPVLTKQRWLYRVDMVVNLRRVIVRAYPVLNLKRAEGIIVDDEGFSRPFDTGVVP